MRTSARTNEDPPDSAPHGQPRAGLPAPAPVLVISRGPRRGERIRLDRETTAIGRHADSRSLLLDVTVSRRHAEFRRSGMVVTVHDMGSATGTYVNDARIQRAELQDGDHIQIGIFQFTYSSGGGDRQHAQLRPVPSGAMVRNPR